MKLMFYFDVPDNRPLVSIPTGWCLYGAVGTRGVVRRKFSTGFRRETPLLRIFVWTGEAAAALRAPRGGLVT